jgi:hypothetical protein
VNTVKTLDAFLPSEIISSNLLKSLHRKANDLSVKLDSLPTKAAVLEFVGMIPDLTLLEPDGKPESRWRLFSGDSVDHAWKNALFSANDYIWMTAPGTHEFKDSYDKLDTDTISTICYEEHEPPVRGVRRIREFSDIKIASNHHLLRSAEWESIYTVVWDMCWLKMTNALDSLPEVLKVPDEHARNISGAAQMKVSICSDAVHFADLLLYSDLLGDKAEGHIEHSLEIWKVWEKGYMPVAEINRIKFVSALKPEFSPAAASLAGTVS